jgi:GLPGLI family protein
MKKINIFTLLILVNYNLISQNTNVVSYGVIFENVIENDENLKNSFFFKLILESQNDIKFELKFNDSVSSFKAKENLKLDNRNKVKMASNLIVEGEYFRNIKSNIIINKAYGINHYIDKDLVWLISSENKTIDSIVCYKATSVKKIENSKGSLSFPITAWFAPSIPYQYGPSVFGGLPGLIVELHERNFVILLNKITFNTNEEVEKFPTKNIISEEEYNEKTIWILSLKIFKKVC